MRQTLADKMSILSSSTNNSDVKQIAGQISVPLPSITEPNRKHIKVSNLYI